MAGGGLGYRYTEETPDNPITSTIGNQEHLIQLNPVIGYFVFDHLAAGLSFEYLYDYIRYDNNVTIKSVQSDYAIAPFVRYYFKFGLFLHAEFGFGMTNLDIDANSIPTTTGYLNYSSETNYKILGFSGGIGYSVHLNNSLAIEPSIRYLNLRNNEKNDNQKDSCTRGVLFNTGLVCYF